jgi:hypothetical protein
MLPEFVPATEAELQSLRLSEHRVARVARAAMKFGERRYPRKAAPEHLRHLIREIYASFPDILQETLQEAINAKKEDD